MPDDPGPDQRKRAFSTLQFPRRCEWVRRVDTIDGQSMPARTLVPRLLSAAQHYDALIVNGSGAPFRELAAAAATVRRRGAPKVIVADCVWGVGSSRIDRMLTRAGIRVLDSPRVHYCVHSREQRERFPALWGVNASRVHVTPYYYTLSEEELEQPITNDGTVFAGGDSNRDYEPLIGAARRIDAPFRLATGRLSALEPAQLPANVRAGRVPHTEFARLLRSAGVVVVALQSRDDRSAGEQTYLNAMALGKPVIVIDSMGVREYVEDRVTGLVVPPGDPDALAEAIAWTLDERNAQPVRAMGERAHAAARDRFGPDAYVAGLLRVLDDVLAS